MCKCSAIRIIYFKYSFNNDYLTYQITYMLFSKDVNLLQSMSSVPFIYNSNIDTNNAIILISYKS